MSLENGEPQCMRARERDDLVNKKKKKKGYGFGYKHPTKKRDL